MRIDDYLKILKEVKKNLFKLLFLFVLPFVILQWSQVYLPIWIKSEKSQITVYINNESFSIDDKMSAQEFSDKNISYQVIFKDGDDMYYKWPYPHQEQKWIEKNGKIILVNPREFDVRFISKDNSFMISIHGYPTMTPFENINITLNQNGEVVDKKPLVTGFSREQKIKNVVRLLVKNYFIGLFITFVASLLAKPLSRFPFKTHLSLATRKGFKNFSLFLVTFFSISSLVTALFVHYRILDHMPHSKEEVLYLFQAKVFSQGKLFTTSHPLKEFFDFEYMINNGKWYSKESPGASLVFTLGHLFGHPEVVNPILFALTVFLAYLVGKSLYGKAEGVVASLLITLSPTLILFGANFFSDMPNLFFRTAFMLTFFYLLKYWSKKWAVVTSSLAGLALLTRPYDTLFFLIPFAVYYAFNFFKNLNSEKLKATLVFLFIFLTFGFLYLGYNWRLSGSPFLPTQMVYSKHDFPGFGQRGVEWPITFGVDEALKNLYFNLLSTAKAIWGWPEYLSFAFVFIAFLLNFKKGYNWLLLGVFLSNLIAYFFYHHHGNIYGPRYYVASFSALALLTSSGIFSLFRPLRKNHKIFAYLALVLTITFLSFVSIKFNKSYLPKYKNFNGMDRKLLDKAGKEIVKPALVFIPARGAWWDYGQFFWTHGPDLSADIVYALDESDYHLTPYHPEWQRKKWKNSDLLPYFPGRSYYQLKGDKFEPL